MQPREWQLYTTNSAETEITVHMLANPTIPFDRIGCDEGDPVMTVDEILEPAREAVASQLGDGRGVGPIRSA